MGVALKAGDHDKRQVETVRNIPVRNLTKDKWIDMMKQKLARSWHEGNIELPNRAYRRDGGFKEVEIGLEKKECSKGVKGGLEFRRLNG